MHMSTRRAELVAHVAQIEQLESELEKLRAGRLDTSRAARSAILQCNIEFSWKLSTEGEATSSVFTGFTASLLRRCG